MHGYFSPHMIHWLPSTPSVILTKSRSSLVRSEGQLNQRGTCSSNSRDGDQLSRVGENGNRSSSIRSRLSKNNFKRWRFTLAQTSTMRRDGWERYTGKFRSNPPPPPPPKFENAKKEPTISASKYKPSRLIQGNCPSDKINRSKLHLLLWPSLFYS